MSEQIKQVAARVKELREISGVSPESLAKQFGITKEKYESYESGSVDIPVSFLYEIANRFKVELTEILTGESPRLHIYSVVRKGGGLSVERRKEYNYQNLAYNFIHKKSEPFLVTVKPDDAPVSYNSHPGQEFNFVIAGTLEVCIDGHQIVLNEGDSLYFDSSYNHGMKALNNEPAQFLAIILDGMGR